MNLEQWAETLLSEPVPAAAIDLHVKDAVAAFLVGVNTEEGAALARLYGARIGPANWIAAAAAIVRLSECDDIHLASCVTPGSVVIPIALALAQSSSEREFHRAVAAGYAAGLHLGLGIGGAKALACGVWPTLFAAPLMAAVTASCLSGHGPDRLSHAMALALAGSSGRLGRPIGTPSGRWFLLAQAVLKGIHAAEAAGQRFRGDLTILSRPWLSASAGHDEVDLAGFDSSPAAPLITEVGFKPFPIARQGANAVIAFQRLLSQGLDPNRIQAIEVFVPAMNVALLSRPARADDRLSLLCNMGFQLACAALAPEMLYDTARSGQPPGPLLEFAGRVSVTAAPDLESYLPDHWPARVRIDTGSERMEETIVKAPFDHGEAGLSQVLNDKWKRLIPSQTENGLLDGGHAVLWQRIVACVSMAAQQRPHPDPIQG